MENENKNNQLQIELKEEVAQGTYANLAIITHSTSEFILDFVRIMPGLPKAGNFGQIRMPEEQNNGSKTFVPPLSDFKGEA